MPARPATTVTGDFQQIEILVPLPVLDLPAVLGGLDRAIHTGMTLEIVDDAGADGEGKHHVEEIPPMFAGKT
ncbi:hypothetical protein D3C73_1414240 [compost metagenome]